MPQTRRKQRILWLTFLFAFLLVSPFMLVLRQTGSWAGMPLSYLLLFGLWLSFIIVLRHLIRNFRSPSS